MGSITQMGGLDGRSEKRSRVIRLVDNWDTVDWWRWLSRLEGKWKLRDKRVGNRTRLD